MQSTSCCLPNTAPTAITPLRRGNPSGVSTGAPHFAVCRAERPLLGPPRLPRRGLDAVPEDGAAATSRNLRPQPPGLKPTAPATHRFSRTDAVERRKRRLRSYGEGADRNYINFLPPRSSRRPESSLSQKVLGASGVPAGRHGLDHVAGCQRRHQKARETAARRRLSIVPVAGPQVCLRAPDLPHVVRRQCCKQPFAGHRECGCPMQLIAAGASCTGRRWGCCLRLFSIMGDQTWAPCVGGFRQDPL
jgi:hypothetical protein